MPNALNESLTKCLSLPGNSDRSHVNTYSDEALFEHAHAALLFAFRYNLEQYEPTPIAALIKRKEGFLGTGKGLVGMDGAAQAGRIRCEVGQLPRLEQLMLTARFGIGKEKLSAADALVMPCIAQLPSGVHPRRMIDAFLVKHFKIPTKRDEVKMQEGKVRVVWNYVPVRMVAVADLVSMHHDTIGQKWRIVRKFLSLVEKRADEMIYERLSEAGIISGIIGGAQ